MRHRLVRIVLAAAIVGAACGGEGDDVATADPATETIAPDTAPSTPAPSTTAPGGAAEAAAAAWALVFDSSVALDDKAEHLDDADALEPIVAAYAAAGDGFGGITLTPTDVAIEGDTATVTYDVEFGGTSAYTAQTGALSLVDGVWQVDRDEFCSFMASARISCAD